jgi:signal transduction histidine kinase
LPIPEGPLRHRKQILLFLVAVLIPSLTLIFFTQKILRQEKELSLKRAADERERRTREIGRDLQLRLERLKLDVSQDEAAILDHPDAYSPLRPELVAVALVENGRIVLPWEGPALSSQAMRRALGTPAVAKLVREGERAEFEKKNPALAASQYKQALEASAVEGKAYIRLLLARALSKAGRRTRASAEYGSLLNLSPHEKDEDGMPIYLYAADRMAGDLQWNDKVIDKLDAALTIKPWMSLPEAGLFVSVIERINGMAGLSDRARSRLAALNESAGASRAKTEHLLSVREELSRRELRPQSDGQSSSENSAWEVDGKGEWLLGSGLLRADRRCLLVVDIAALNAALLDDRTFRQAYPAKVLLTASEASGGEPLGPNLRGLYLVQPESSAGPASSNPVLSRPFYLLTMIAVILFASLGGYLLWRDVRRDLDLAEIRSQFAASVSHELKTPLTSIRMFAETVRLGRVKDVTARDEYLDTIINESERLSRLLNNVLDVSKIEQGKKLYHPRPQALAPVLRTAVRTMDYPLRQQGFSLELAIDDDLPDVRVDADALEQALLNLIGNAIKYSGSSREIGLKLTREGSWAVIRVTDHGVGIPPGDRQRIFERFYRVPSPENRQVPGTGLGLALVTHFVQEHRGRIEVDGAPGHGSTFSVYLPLEVEP